MTWYNTYEEIKAKYPDTVFEEYWLTKDDVDKLREHEGDERNILLHIGILSPFNDDPVIIIKQKGI